MSGNVTPIRQGLVPVATPIEQVQSDIIERQSKMLNALADLLAGTATANDIISKNLRAAERQCRITAGEKVEG